MDPGAPPTRSSTRGCRRLAGALAGRGVGVGDTVSLMAPNVPEMLEAHFGVPMCGAVLNALNYRLDAATIRFILGHAETKVLITDREFSPMVAQALEGMNAPPVVIDIDDPLCESGERIGEKDYEAFIDEGSPGFEYRLPDDEWQAISLGYTSGTTGNPKGVVCHHRGAYLNAVGQMLAFGIGAGSRYLWTLPMFHCNGWTYTWGVTAAGGTHVCLRAVDPALIFSLIEEHGVTHMCGAPVVLNLLLHAPELGQAPFRARRRGGHRRRGAAERSHRGDVGDGIQRHPSLRSHRDLRAGHGVCVAGGVGGARHGSARGSDGPSGRPLSHPCTR